MAFIAILSYGIVSIVGGFIGYTQSKSKVSLISGSISGALLLGCSYFITQGLSWALLTGVAICVALIAVFIMRFKKTGKFMPAGLMIILGVISSGLTLTEFFLA